MKKKMIALSLSSILLFGCGSSKPATDDCCKPKTEVVSGEHDPVMKLLISGIVVLALNVLLTK